MNRRSVIPAVGHTGKGQVFAGSKSSHWEIPRNTASAAR
jgi:hypothetical protein